MAKTDYPVVPEAMWIASFLLTLSAVGNINCEDRVSHLSAALVEKVEQSSCSGPKVRLVSLYHAATDVMKAGRDCFSDAGLSHETRTKAILSLKSLYEYTPDPGASQFIETYDESLLSTPWETSNRIAWVEFFDQQWSHFIEKTRVALQDEEHHREDCHLFNLLLSSKSSGLSLRDKLDSYESLLHRFPNHHPVIFYEALCASTSFPEFFFLYAERLKQVDEKAARVWTRPYFTQSLELIEQVTSSRE